MMESPSKEKICLFGIGQVFEDLIEEVKEHYEVEAISDNNPVYWGRFYRNIKCVAPEELKGKAVYVTIGDRRSSEEVIEQLKAVGCLCRHISECPGISFDALEYSTLNDTISLDSLAENYADCRGNGIILEGKNLIRNCQVVFSGENNRVIFEEGIVFRSPVVISCFGEGNRVHIGRDVRIGRPGLQSDISVYNGSACQIGGDTDIQQCTIVLNEGGMVDIGERCMFAYGVKIRQNDFHPIYDIETGERINKSRDIKIDNEVWLGEDVMLLGGAEIGKGSVLGAKAVTSGRFGENQLIVGSPAKVISENICWKEDKIK